MTFFPDKRSRYRGAAPWDFAPGVGAASNTPQQEPRTDIAKREQVPGEHFREVTAMTPPENPVVSAQEPESTSGDIQESQRTATPTGISSVLATEKPAVPSQ